MEDVRVIPRRRADVYTVTDAHRPLSEDIDHRQRRYLLSMGIRTLCFVLAVILASLHAAWWAIALPLVGALILPYISVVFANGGREPEARATFTTDDGSSQKGLSGPRPEIRS